MARFRVSPTAQRDIDQIGEVIARDNPVRALSFVRELRARIRDAARNPLLYRERTELRDGLRAIRHGNYMIYFVFDGDLVDILRVWHGARDENELFKD
jgi:toxin ParE1/3/4